MRLLGQDQARIVGRQDCLAFSIGPSSHEERHFRQRAALEFIRIHFGFAQLAAHVDFHSRRFARAVVAHGDVPPLVGLSGLVGGAHFQRIVGPFAHEVEGDFVADRIDVPPAKAAAGIRPPTTPMQRW